MKTNSKGQTLEQFLAEYKPSDYRHPSVTADCVIFSGNSVLLVRRGNHPYIGELAFPGGFCEPCECSEMTAERELNEETGVTGAPLRQFYTASTPGRDPRDWTFTVCYTAELPNKPHVEGGDDASHAEYYDYTVAESEGVTTLTLRGSDGESVSRLEVVRDACGKIDVINTRLLTCGMAFDHAQILLRAIEER